MVMHSRYSYLNYRKAGFVLRLQSDKGATDLGGGLKQKAIWNGLFGGLLRHVWNVCDLRC